MKREKSVPTRGMVEEGRNRGVSEGDIRMLDWEKSSGAEMETRKTLLFLPPVLLENMNPIHRQQRND
jgi:hypothetical protein